MGNTYKKLKPKNCRVCGVIFAPYVTTQIVCGFQCSIKWPLLKKQKELGKVTTINKNDLKRKQDYEKELETIFNEYIRERDKNQPCISCGKRPGTYKMSAGHFYPAGTYKNLRFNEDNVHGQCWFNCNKNKHGNLSEYRPRLIKRIGLERVEELDWLRNFNAHFSIPELIEMKVKYKDKVKKLKE